MISQTLLSNQRRIGLTGGIASGKSTIATYISKTKNVFILDADDYSKKFLCPGSDSYTKIIDHFGKQIIQLNCLEKSLNRKKLKKIIFEDAKERMWLDNLLHPLIKEQMRIDCIKLSNEKILILVIPLLFEADFADLCSEIWLIKCRKETQKQRLIMRDKISPSYAEKIINIQLDFSEKEKKSDFILNNENQQEIWKNAIDNLL